MFDCRLRNKRHSHFSFFVSFLYENIKNVTLKEDGIGFTLLFSIIIVIKEHVEYILFHISQLFQSHSILGLLGIRSIPVYLSTIDFRHRIFHQKITYPLEMIFNENILGPGIFSDNASINILEGKMKERERVERHLQVEIY